MPLVEGGDETASQAAKIFMERIAKEGQAIWNCEQGLTKSSTDTDLLLDRLESGLKKTHRKVVQHLLRTGLAQGNRSGLWTCYLPPLRRNIRPAMPLVRQCDFARLPVLRAVQEAILRQLDRLPLADRDVSAGLIIVSAAAFGGLVHKQWLSALGFANYTSCSVGPAGLRIELIDPTNSSLRRSFFPDPFTEFVFLRHWLSHDLPLVTPKPGQGRPPHERCLKALMNSIKMDTRTSSELVSNLHAAAFPALFIQAPGCMSAYAIRRFSSTSLPESVSRRVFNECSKGMDIGLSSPSSAAERPFSTFLPKNCSRRDWYLRTILHHLSQFAQPVCRHTAGEIEEMISAVKPPQDCWRVESLLCQWVLEQLLPQAHKSLAPASIARYFQSIWQPLFVAATDLDLLDLDGDSTADLYDRALSLVPSTAGRRYLQSRLAAFHAWLRKQHNLAEVDFSELDHYVADKGAVRANVITVPEFRAAISLLEDPDLVLEDWLREVCVLVLILCFRLGLRRREPLQARLCDFREVGNTLWVRPSMYGSVKSRQSIRKLPLASLLEADELERFHRWFRRVAERVGEPKVSQHLIFCNPDQPQVVLDPQRVFEKIMKAVRTATNDPTLVPHHLRHSFANWTFIRLQLAGGYFNLPTGLPAFDDCAFSIDRCVQLKSNLYNYADSAIHDIGRRDLYCVASLMGHLSPATTVSSYIHLFDFLTSRFTRDYPRVDRIEDLANLMGVDRSRIYQIAKSKNITRDKLFSALLSSLRERAQALICQSP